MTEGFDWAKLKGLRGQLRSEKIRWAKCFSYYICKIQKEILGYYSILVNEQKIKY